MEGGYQFLDCIIAPDTCAQLNRCVENIEKLGLCEKEKFFVSYADVPMKSTGAALKHYVRQMREHVLKPLHENYGIDISDAAIRRSVDMQNEVGRLMREIGDYRKEDNPRITGYEYAVLCLATYCCPHDKLLGILRETAEELRSRTPDDGHRYRVRVVLAGSEIDDADMVRLIEEAGALVVADRHCLGSLPGRNELVLKDDEDALTQVCRAYLEWGQCPRFMNTEKILERQGYIDRLAREYRADGIILQQIKFCDYWGYERAHLSHVMREDYGYPVLSVDRPYVVGNSGQLRTRVQAFVESVEVKKINYGKNDGK
jgi:benzoyl-CoA reductase/2-hydroxyglutaryl-CoA dehydratase subunit BcrC/BadD/HgdB